MTIDGLAIAVDVNLTPGWFRAWPGEPQASRATSCTLHAWGNHRIPETALAIDVSEADFETLLEHFIPDDAPEPRRLRVVK